MKRIKITASGYEFIAELYNTPTAAKLLDELPLEGTANIWGDEIYFNVEVECKEEKDARQVVEVGELGYWPMGPAFCIFYGPTPISDGNEPRAYSNVNVFGRIVEGIENLRKVNQGEKVKVEIIS